VAGVIAAVLSLLTAGSSSWVSSRPLSSSTSSPPAFRREAGSGPSASCASSFRGGLLVLSAWCLGVLNSHRRFFLSYAAPVVWNFTMIAAMLAFGRGAAASTGLAAIVAVAATIGSALQIALQLPTVLRLARA